ncbi:MAG: tetratricopeptide repeat protein [Desulfosarcinaceae bacterium]|nr:tetratricopeptide repeat protein [Desulfosarcinaceae bacterium]
MPPNRIAPLSHLELGQPMACRSILLLCAAVLVVYGNSFHCEWHYDDIHNIIENPHIQIENFSVATLWEAMAKGSQEQGRSSRPLAFLSFALNYLHGGLEVFGYHVVNVGIHFLAAVALFLLIRRMLRLPRLKATYGDQAGHIALLGAVLWAVHPLNVTAVTYIVQRMASMAALFYLLSLYAYIGARTAEGRPRQWGWWTLCVAAALAAVASKENAVLAPISILAMEYYLIQEPGHKLPFSFKLSVVLIVTLLAIGGIHRLVVGGVFGDYQFRPFTPLQRLLTQPRLLLFYLGLMIYPTGSRMMLLHDPLVSTSWTTPATTLPALIIVGAIIVFSLIGRRRFPLVGFALLFYFLNHAVESSIIPLELVYEHRNYLPMVFLHLLLAILVLRALAYFRESALVRPILLFAIAFFIGANGYATYLYNAVFKTDLGMWLNNARKTPHLSVVQNNLGNVLLTLGETEKGKAAIEKALASGRYNNRTQEPVVYYNLGRVYERLEGLHSEKAIEAYQRAVQMSPVLTKAWLKLALNASRSGNYEAAEAHILKAIQYSRHPEDPALLNSLSLVQLKLGQHRAAYRNAVKVVVKRPSGIPPRAIMAEIHRQRGQLGRAASLWREVLSIQPTHRDALLALTELYTQLDKVVERAGLMDRLMSVQPGQPLVELLAMDAAYTNTTAWRHNKEILRRAFAEHLRGNLDVLESQLGGANE